MNARSRLFIDRLSLTIQIDRDDQRAVKGNLDYLVIDEAIEEIRDKHSEFFKGYRYAYRLMFDDEYFCAIQIAPYKPGHRFMRLEWNPASAERACPNAIDRISEVLAACVPSGGSRLIPDANITRIDLSFDLQRVPIGSFFVNAALRKNYSGQYLQFHEKFGKHGHLNARYIGKPESDQYLLMYDRNLHMEIQQIRKNPHSAGTSNIETEIKRVKATKTRFELRLRRVGPWSNLTTRPNPFERYTVVQYLNMEIATGDHQWNFFVAGCHLYGAQAALSMIKNRREREQYSETLRNFARPTWWDPVEIQAELPNAVRRAVGIEL